METQRIGISWPLSDKYGWGVFGLNVTLELLERDGPRPLLLAQPNIDHYPPGVREKLEPLIKEQQDLVRVIRERGAGKHAHLKEVLVLHALANQFLWSDMANTVSGRRNVGFIFFEHTRFEADALARARRFDRILVGSTWNLEVLKRNGLSEVSFVMQGIDASLFHPRPKSGMFAGRFAIFSGGKLEIRKAQDAVIAAFKAFRARHPDAVLVSAWHNVWPETALSIAQSPYVAGAPAIDGAGRLEIAAWARDQGVPADAFVDLGMLPHAALAQVLGECDVALFPNRCEGGTNLVAMEAMACGLPCVLSANTGHLDLVRGGNCYPLARQAPVPSHAGVTDGWGEPSIDEIVETLEDVYADRAEAARRAERGAQFMQCFTWNNQTTALMATIADLL